MSAEGAHLASVRRLLANGWVRYLIGPGLLAFGGLLPVVPRVLFIVAGLAVVTGSSLTADRTLEVAQQTLRQEDSRLALLMLLQNAVTMIEAARTGVPERTLRANIMLFDETKQGLRIAYATSGYDAEERALVWQNGQGCAGEAWSTRQTVVGPEDSELPVASSDAVAISRPWNMTPAQVRMTADRIASLVSVPVPDANDATQVVAIFTLDDSKPLPESLLGDPDVRAAAEGLVQDAGRLLNKIGLGFPD